LTRITPADEAAIRRLNAEGLGCTRIGRQLELHPSTVDNVRRRLGLPCQTVTGAPKGNRNAARHPAPTPTLEAEVCRLHGLGWGCTRIGQALRLERTSVNRLRQRLGLSPQRPAAD
jgi:IS30 family transposase